MSWLDKFRNWVGGLPPEEPADELPPVPEPRPRGSESLEPAAQKGGDRPGSSWPGRLQGEPGLTALEQLERALERWRRGEAVRAGTDASASPPDGEGDRDLVRRFDAAVREGPESAIDLVREVLTQHTVRSVRDEPRLPRSLHELAQRAAETLVGRGELRDAELLLEPLIGATTPPLSALMLAGEVAELRQAPGDALAAYERVLARRIDFPGARERAARLRDDAEGPGELAGATLVADGALARGRYRVLRHLGRGGAGTVFLARDARVERHVALKVYHRRGLSARQRLRMEARTPARLEHPGVVRIFDLDEELMAIAMEHVPGGSVRDRLSRRAAPVEEARRWLVTAAEAMAFVHGRGWVHRDLKPSNWLLRSDGRVVLTDFGVAARIGQAPSARVGGGEGTLAYMPPEQRAGAPAQPAEDVHAFGATLAEIAEVVGGDNAAWVELAKACMRREPRDRPTVVELRAALGEAGDDRGPGALAAPSARS